MLLRRPQQGKTSSRNLQNGYFLLTVSLKICMNKLANTDFGLNWLCLCMTELSLVFTSSDNLPFKVSWLHLITTNIWPEPNFSCNKSLDFSKLKQTIWKIYIQNQSNAAQKMSQQGVGCKGIQTEPSTVWPLRFQLYEKWMMLASRRSQRPHRSLGLAGENN